MSLAPIESSGSELPIEAYEEGIETLSTRAQKSDSSSYDNDYSEESTREYIEKTIIIPNKRNSNRKKRKKISNSKEMSQLKFIATQVFFIFVIHIAKALTDKVIGVGRNTTGEPGQVDPMMDLPYIGGNRHHYPYSTMVPPSVLPRKINAPINNYNRRGENPGYYQETTIQPPEILQRKDMRQLAHPHYGHERDHPKRRHELRNMDDSIPGNFSQWNDTQSIPNKRYR